MPISLILSLVTGGASRLVRAVLGCTPCLVALAIAAAFFYGDYRGAHRERVACHAADIAMQLRAKERDASIAEDKARFAESQKKDLQAALAASDEKVSGYEKLLKSGKIGRCALSPDAAERLRYLLHR